MASSITSTLDPIDAFIYQGAFFSSNSNDLRDENGLGGAVDFTMPLFGAGYSVEFDGVSWGVQNNPTPGSGLIANPEPSTGLSVSIGLIALSLQRRGSWR